jgi:hypothetical protein
MKMDAASFDLTAHLIAGVTANSGDTGETGATSRKAEENSVTPEILRGDTGETGGAEMLHPLHLGTSSSATRKPAENLDVSPVAPVSPQKHDVGNREAQLAWREGIAFLDPEKPRGGFHWRRWDNLVADCVLIFNEFGEQATATGWTAEDLFGVDPAGAGGSIVGGLAWRLEGRKLLTVESGMATFQYRNGEIGRCSRGWVRGLVPVWELGE